VPIALAPSAPAHHELFLAVDAIQLTAIHHVAFPRQQPAQAAIAEAASLRRRLSQAFPHRRIIGSSRPVVQTRPTEPRQPACAHPAHAILMDELRGGRPSRRRRHPFFSSRSLSTALSSMASASSFFSRRFLSSSDFSRRASDTSSQPYLAFHL
jgi:hypothetical protein